MLNELPGHDLFPFALCGRIRWSKNGINTEKKASRVLKEILESDEFKDTFGDGRGLDAVRLG